MVDGPRMLLETTVPVAGTAEQAVPLALLVAARDPDRLSVEWRKAKREGRILIDTARNTYAQTTVAPYAVRARPRAPVATPLRWEELEDPRLRADAFTLTSLPVRLERDGDPWAAIGHG